MMKVALIGTGNVSRHLFAAFVACPEVEVVQVVGRDPLALADFALEAETGNLEALTQEADVYIIAVSDDSIHSVSEIINIENKLVTHTSGAVGMSALKAGNRRGVFYPLQSFSHNRKLDFSIIPICIEAESADDLRTLQTLGKHLSEKVVQLNSAARAKLHLAAVFTNNFTNHLYHLAFELLGQDHIPTDLLLPLLRETADKISDISPYEAQTGPARRGDLKSIQLHKTLLNNPQHREIYTLLSESIMKTYGKKL